VPAGRTGGGTASYRPWLFDESVVDEVRRAAEKLARIYDRRNCLWYFLSEACCATRADALGVAPRLDGGYHRAAVTNDCCLGPAVTRQDDYGRRRGAAVPVGVGTTFAYDGETVTIVKMAAVPSRPCQRVPAAARTQRGCVAISSGAVYQFRGPRRGGDPAAVAADREPGGDVDRCGRGGQNALSIFRCRTGCPSMRLPLLIFP
jgi:hypothetical protein